MIADVIAVTRRLGRSAIETSGPAAHFVKNFVRQYGDLVGLFDPLRDAQPVKAGKNVDR